MRQNDLSLANFILRFGPDEVLLDHAEEIVVPAFTQDGTVRTRGETTYRFHKVVISKVGEEKSGPILAISGHFVKDTVLIRQQIFRRDIGIVEDVRTMESAPSAFFVLLLNNHRLLYFAETVAAPSLESFRATAEYLLREQWHRYIRQRYESDNVTRRGVDRLTIKDLQRRVPPPVLAVVPVAGEEEITDVIQRFKKIKQVKFRLMEPNDELDASAAIAAVEHSFRPLRPTRLEVLASDPRGMNKKEAEAKISEVAEGQNTHIEIEGEDAAGFRLKVDNDEFALSIPIGEPPANDADLRKELVDVYVKLGDEGKIRRIPTAPGVMEKILRLMRFL
ncbi:hypothetical protein HNP52_003714 [Sphingomonas kyeonggiensis]|uniref:Uncharacterized protein n=1 Tax=Sphingomonas kyeonggiensis TaxID=1268553 RepID=A0A7W7K3Z0_9SPHN|nr:hypothetical protein [Sphingomonas kyeonggiensis]MBB4840622.1 hypothetical protein [Sphingomonas kyeonggiensis]